MRIFANTVSRCAEVITENSLSRWGEALFTSADDLFQEIADQRLGLRVGVRGDQQEAEDARRERAADPGTGRGTAGRRRRSAGRPSAASPARSWPAGFSPSACTRTGRARGRRGRGSPSGSPALPGCPVCSIFMNAASCTPGGAARQGILQRGCTARPPPAPRRQCASPPRSAWGRVARPGSAP